MKVNVQKEFKKSLVIRKSQWERKVWTSSIKGSTTLCIDKQKVAEHKYPSSQKWQVAH